MANNTDHKLMISGAELKESVVFKAEDVESIDMIAAAGQWIKFKLCLKNGFKAILSFMVVSQGQKGIEFTMGYQNFEWWLMNILYKIPTSNCKQIQRKPTRLRCVGFLIMQRIFIKLYLRQYILKVMVFFAIIQKMASKEIVITSNLF